MLITIFANNTTKDFNTTATTWGAFFEELADETGICEKELRDSITAYNDMAVTFGATSDADDIQLSNHDKFELDIDLPEMQEEGAEAEEAPAYSAASITVTRAGDCRPPLRVNITGEHTRVRDIITDTMANFFASNKNELEEMNVKINDVEADLDTEVRADDAVCFCSKNAGRKGSCGCCGDHSREIRFSVISPDGYCVSASVPREELEELGVEDVADLKAACIDMIVDRDGIIEITSINGVGVAESDFVFQTDAGIVTDIGFHADCKVLELDSSLLGAQIGETEEDEESPADPDPVSVKEIKVNYSVLDTKYTIITGKTTVGDVMDGLLNQFGITAADLRKLSFSIDGVSADLDTVLTAADEELVITPNAGTKGC